MIRLIHVSSAIAVIGVTWITQPISLFKLPLIGAIAQAQQFSPSTTAPVKAALPGKVVNDLKNYQSLKIQVGSDTYLVDKADMTHFLTRHHPNYWDGSVKQNQTFFNKNMTISDVEQAIKSVMNTRRNEVIKIGTSGIGQLPDTQVGGVTYVLGLNKGHVGQFYPKVP
ncbi:MAG: hypothetical protein HC824_20010 [Synechococcales cyanobacterium RM1_1_8]|nr:hypothetical protein [Synechococcales cyanobacterium RM1_1_8]